MTLPRYRIIEKVLNDRVNFQITKYTALARLSHLKVHGAFDQRRESRLFYIGYDYVSQEWIQFYLVY